MSADELREQLKVLTEQLGGRALDAELADWLNREHGPGSETFQQLEKSCRSGVVFGWLCKQEAGGIRYGRVFKAEDDLQRFSVDVVDMENVVGPEHSHPNGEIDLIMPQKSNALFDGHAAGWAVYPPGSVHRPTVSEGRALIMYLLPEGSIKFSR
ncbi:MAG: hypothetical protein ACI9LO_003139 [Planctomycetota bacterium]|jgi:hypothetical protein